MCVSLLILTLAFNTQSPIPQPMHHYQLHYCDIIHTCYYPAHMHRGKVIGLSVCLSVCQSVSLSVCRHHENRQISNLGLRAARKRNQSVEIRERLAWVYFESFGTVHGCHKKVSFLAHCGHAHRPCPLHCTAHAHNLPGRDRQHYRSISVQKVVDARRVRGMCSGEL